MLTFPTGTTDTRENNKVTPVLSGVTKLGPTFFTTENYKLTPVSNGVSKLEPQCTRSQNQMRLESVPLCHTIAYNEKLGVVS